eukprot:11327739-Ditylum_brightwellii.AAC.1
MQDIQQSAQEDKDHPDKLIEDIMREEIRAAEEELDVATGDFWQTTTDLSRDEDTDSAKDDQTDDDVSIPDERRREIREEEVWHPDTPLPSFNQTYFLQPRLYNKVVAKKKTRTKDTRSNISDASHFG